MSSTALCGTERGRQANQPEQSMLAQPDPRNRRVRDSVPDPQPDEVTSPPVFAEVYEDQFDFVWRTAQRFGVPADSVADAVQEVFLVVHRKLPGFEGRSSLRTWLYAITRRVAHNRRKELRPSLDGCQVDTPLDTLAASEPSPETQTEIGIVMSIIAQMDDEKREVFVLAELEQLSVVEISEMMDLNLNTAHARLRAARQQFDKACARLRAREARWRQPA